jgi:hypothetical protein
MFVLLWLTYFTQHNVFKTHPNCSMCQRISSFFFFLQYWGLNSGLWTSQVGALALEPQRSPFCFGYFGDRVLLFFFLESRSSQPQALALLQMTRYVPLFLAIGWDVGVSWTPCPGWPLTEVLQISPSQVERITGVRHWCLTRISSFLKVKCYYILYAQHLLLSLSFVGRLDCFHLWLLWIILIGTWVFRYLFDSSTFSSLDVYLELELLDHMIVLSLIFLRKHHTVFHSNRTTLYFPSNAQSFIASALNEPFF